MFYFSWVLKQKNSTCPPTALDFDQTLQNSTNSRKSAKSPSKQTKTSEVNSANLSRRSVKTSPSIRTVTLQMIKVINFAPMFPLGGCWLDYTAPSQPHSANQFFGRLPAPQHLINYIFLMTRTDWSKLDSESQFNMNISTNWIVGIVLCPLE